MPRYSRGFDTDAAFDYLAKRDRKLGTWMKRIGPIEADQDGDTVGPIPALPSAPIQAASGPELTGLKLQGPVKYVRQPARKAATATYVGFMAELENVRNAVRAWALTQGYEPTGRPYEVYKNGVDKAFTADENNQPQGQFDVYWDLK